MSKSTLALLAAVAIPVSASADVLVFTLDGGEGNSTFQTSNGPLTLTISNFNTPFGKGFTNGLGVGTEDLRYSTTFQISFNYPVLLTEYTTGAASNIGATFDLTGGSSADSTGNALAATTHYTTLNSGPFALNANQVATFTANFSSSEFAFINSFTVISAVPEPGAWALLGGGLVGAMVAFDRYWRRRRAADVRA